MKTMLRNTLIYVIFSLLYLKSASSQACYMNPPFNIFDYEDYVFWSANHPGLYPTNSECHWNVSVISDNPVRIDFDAFDTNPGDTVVFYDGDVPHSPPILATISGTYTASNPPPSVITTGPSFYAVFTSGSSNTNKFGFLAKYNGDFGCRKGAYNVLDSFPATLTSPYFPRTYPPSETCRWHFKAPPGQILRLSFAELDIYDTVNCTSDYLQMTDGTDDMGRWCGHTLPSAYMSYGSDVYLTFQSDASYSTVFSGFELGFTSGLAEQMLPEHSLKVPTKGVMRTTNNQAISQYCLDQYNAGYRSSVRKLLFKVQRNMQATGVDICDGMDFNVFTAMGNLTLGNPTYTANAIADFHIELSLNHTFGQHHTCAHTLHTYVANLSNWPQPIISTPGGCNAVIWEPYTLEVRGDKNWWCKPPSPVEYGM